MTISDENKARARELAKYTCLTHKDWWCLDREPPCTCNQRIAAAIASAELRGRIEGLKEARDSANERASEYARFANRYSGDELGIIYTDKCGVCASISSRIDARLASLQPEVAKREEGV